MIDLHVHSTYSDGTLSPEELIALAEQIGLEAVALCDHNTVAGLPDFLAAAAGKKLQAVPGVEFSTDYQGTELHILGLFIEPEHYAAVTDKVNWMLIQKEQSNRDLVEALKPAGILLDYEAIRARTPNGQVNRAVIAAEMVRRGYCESVQDCFKQWLSPKRGYFKPPARLDVFDVIRFIKSIGAVAVLAHPFLSMDEQLLRAFLPRAVEAGLDAMEVFYSKYTEETTLLAVKIAEEYGILPSGGSDYHGGNKPDIAIGIGRGDLKIPHRWLNGLKKRK